MFCQTRTITHTHNYASEQHCFRLKQKNVCMKKRIFETLKTKKPYCVVGAIIPRPTYLGELICLSERKSIRTKQQQKYINTIQTETESTTQNIPNLHSKFVLHAFSMCQVQEPCNRSSLSHARRQPFNLYKTVNG